MFRKNKCPACQMMRGKRPTGKALCRDCTGNRQVASTWDEIQILELLTQTHRMFTCALPVLLLCSRYLMCRQNGEWTGIKFGVLAGELVAWGMWGFNVFYWWPKCKLRVEQMTATKKEALGRLFVAKVAGVPKEGGM